MACAVDVRDEESVENAVKSTVEKFGRIDILINNASAISLTGTLETSMKHFDLMHKINTRGTFLVYASRSFGRILPFSTFFPNFISLIFFTF